MADIVDKNTRSRMMSGIRARNTLPEMRLRRALHARGFRYRLHRRELPGTPDIVLARYNAVVLVHGCFWHRHVGCRYATNPSTRPEFWKQKFGKNVKRDVAQLEALLALGWRVATVWECALRNPEQIEMTSAALEGWLKSKRRSIELGSRTYNP
jgi:DNA mismatch endonuclease (patch repair protein)